MLLVSASATAVRAPTWPPRPFPTPDDARACRDSIAAAAAVEDTAAMILQYYFKALASKFETRAQGNRDAARLEKSP